jgi:hypothetical protein
LEEVELQLYWVAGSRPGKMVDTLGDRQYEQDRVAVVSIQSAKAVVSTDPSHE